MKARWCSALVASWVAAFAGVAAAQEKAAAASEGKPAAMDEHKTLNRGELKWGPAPESLPPGAKAVVVQGDPGVKGELFTVRLKMPKGYTIPPHTHPTAEYVAVLSGTLYLGEGDLAAKKSAKALKAGGWASIPEGHHHYAISDADTEVQVHAMGPFEITYINPADDPRNKKQAVAK